jgi:hypothetical protein
MRKATTAVAAAAMATSASKLISQVLARPD